MESTISVVGLHHDLISKRSVATLMWKDEPEKTLAVVVSFGCPIEHAQSEAEKAVRALANELDRALVLTP